jgi:hypothetical protein
LTATTYPLFRLAHLPPNLVDAGLQGYAVIANIDAAIHDLYIAARFGINAVRIRRRRGILDGDSVDPDELAKERMYGPRG